MTEKNKFTVRDICSAGIFTAFIAVCAQISIPMPYGVPMTLQTLAVPFAGIVLGKKRGAASVLIYILLGAVGLPVFARFSGGPGVLFGPTGGFILSFPVVAILVGGGGRRGALYLALGLATGAVVNYSCGMFFFAMVLSVEIKTAFAACVLPFVPTEIIKLSLAYFLGTNIKKALMRSGVII